MYGAHDCVQHHGVNIPEKRQHREQHDGDGDKQLVDKRQVYSPLQGNREGQKKHCNDEIQHEGQFMGRARGVHAEHGGLPHKAEQAGENEGGDDERHEGGESRQIALRLGSVGREEDRRLAALGTAALQAENRGYWQGSHERKGRKGSEGHEGVDGEKDDGGEQERRRGIQGRARGMHASEHVRPAPP